MAEISDELFEYLFEKIFKDGVTERKFINVTTQSIDLVEVSPGQLYFVNNGKIEESSLGMPDMENTDDMLLVRHMKTLKPKAIPKGFIKKIRERAKYEDFLQEVETLYHRIREEDRPDEDKNREREENRKIFGKLLEEAAQIELELSRRKNEDLWGYAKRLSTDKASYEKREAAKLIKRADEDISELWHRLRYNTDEKHRLITERCIDSIIKKCLSSINELSTILLRRET